MDKSVFERSTGVAFGSDKGMFFRQLAIKSLQAFQDDARQNCFSNKVLAHRLKGIVSTCGADNAVNVCKKIELYDEIMNKHRTKVIFVRLAAQIICELKHNSEE
ncbi:Hpt domain-containing protein [Vibrio owensii]|uniref:Hpt domain-containing protein n=1 Tax=Vibrio owensii TaxID=696485 RepID=UPI003AADA432